MNSIYIHHNNHWFPQMSTRTVNVLMFYGIETAYELRDSFTHNPRFLNDIRKERNCNSMVINELKTFAKEYEL